MVTFVFINEKPPPLCHMHFPMHIFSFLRKKYKLNKKRPSVCYHFKWKIMENPNWDLWDFYTIIADYV